MENLVLNNMGIVYYVIDKKFSWYHKWNQETREDLASEGMLALMYSASKFDPSCGKKFCNFAYDPIIWRVQKYINKQMTNRKNGIKEDETMVSVDSYDAEVVMGDGEEASSLSEIVGGKDDDGKGLVELWELIRESGIKDIELIAKRRDEGYSYQDIGDELGVTREIVRRRINELKKCLSEFYDLEGMKPERIANMYKWEGKKSASRRD